jgi:probable rRNA maturation factor
MAILVHNKTESTGIYENIVRETAHWICLELKIPIVSLDIIFIDDESLRTMHNKYLNDDTVTDVITFNLGDDSNCEGEVYISPDRARKNAEYYHVSLINEIMRLIIHSCLHLAGFEDQNDKDRKILKQKEDDYLLIAVEKFLN